MRSLPSTKLILDTYHPKKDGTQTVKVRVTFRRVSKYYKTKYSLTHEQWTKSYLSSNPRGRNKRLKCELINIATKAKMTSDALEVFTFEAFETAFYKKPNIKDDVLYHYSLKIKELGLNDQIKTQNSYRNRSQKIEEFFSNGSGKNISFSVITAATLSQFEQWMIANEYSISTVSDYLKCLRHIFNNAIQANDISVKWYPFGGAHHLYTIPETQNPKKSIPFEVVKRIKDVNLKDHPQQEKARDFWMLSFYLNGMNVNDMLRLNQDQYDLLNDTITFHRKKSSKAKKISTPTSIIVLPDAANLIQKYKGHGTLLFDNLVGAADERERKRRIDNFNRYISQHMKNVAKRIEHEGCISVSVARHSWATLALNRDISLEHISEGLGHSSMATTRRYTRGLDYGTKMKMANRIFDGL